jgi:hypothetical protein
MHERKLSYTQDYETLQVVAAYTLKANGTRIDIPKNSYLSGFGLTSQPGFRDSHIMSLFYPNLEIGDQVVLVTVHHQLLPWFTGHFDVNADFSPVLAAHDIRYVITAPATMALKIDAMGLDGGAEQAEGGKKRWVWQYHNDKAVTPERDAVSETDFAPHLRVTSFADYPEVARAYRERSQDRTAVTPEITVLADDLTKGVTDKRAQAKLLYDWVSTHIGYVQIVLGAGGFTPHFAKDVVSNRFGDCKDHVVLLEALLAAKGIPSTAVLIHIGTPTYKLSDAATPHSFDHVITYLPDFNLYLDSTAQLAPFGVLPYSDTGKPVLRVDSGEVTITPTPTSANSIVRATSEVALDADGNAQGSTKITAQGAYGISMRDLVQRIPAGKENDLLRSMLGPGAEGTLDRGTPRVLDDPFAFGATYSVPSALALPGPGALPRLWFKPFFFTDMVAGSLPATRSSDYICYSLDATEDVKITLPPDMRLLSIPDPQSFDAEGVHLQIAYDRTSPHVLREAFALKIDHPRETCTPDYYARVHGALAKMTNALRQDVIYKAKSPKADAPK